VQWRPVHTHYFEELAVGMRETISKTVKNADVIGFAELSVTTIPFIFPNISPARRGSASESFMAFIPQA
jgi:hypothetical protein